jgi:hypothetical protein
MPDFMLRLHGGQSFFTKLFIVDSTTGAIAYEADFSDTGGILKNSFTVEMKDMDFDGYQDIEIYTGYAGNWKKDYKYIMWSPSKSSFAGDVYNLAGLGLPTFDTKQELVHSMSRVSAADHWFYTHKYMDGELVVVEEVSDNCVWDYWLDDMAINKLAELEPLYAEGGAFMHYTKKRLDEETMGLVVVEEKFTLLIDGNKVAEYLPGSEIGLLLAECEGNQL